MSIVGDIFGGSSGVDPHEAKWIKNLIYGQYKANRSSGFLPDKDAWEADLQASIDEIMSALPINQEQYNAQLASRGLFTAGEAPAAMYRDVVAPIAGKATSAIASSKLGYANAYQQGMIAEEQRKAQLLQMLMNLNMSGATYQPSGLASALGFGANVVGAYGIANGFGFLKDAAKGVYTGAKSAYNWMT